MADACSECGASKRWGTLKPSDHAGGCRFGGSGSGGGGSKRVARNDNQSGGHVHAYAQTGKSSSSVIRRGRKHVRLTIYELVCPVKDCPRPTIWSDPSEQEL